MSTALYKPRPARWATWRFSLRAFFVLLTLFCVWLGVHVKWIEDRHEALEWLMPELDAGYEPESPFKTAPSKGYYE